MDLHIGGKHNCYTVPECSIDDEYCDSSSTASDRDQTPVPFVLPSTIGAFHTTDGRPPQLGYFVPLSMFYDKPTSQWNKM